MEKKEITVKTLAEISGVTVRTLQYYDEIDLLPPLYVGDNGYRYYGIEQILQLQQILLLRELGFELKEIQRILGSKTLDQMGALLRQRRKLEQDIERKMLLLDTIDSTVRNLKEGLPLSYKEIFSGFDPEKQKTYESWLEERLEDHPETQEIFARARKNYSRMTQQDLSRMQADFDRIHRALAALADSDASVDHPEVQQLVREHYRLICLFWTPSAIQYRGLASLYGEHPDFAQVYHAFSPRLLNFLQAAMVKFSDQGL